MRTLCTLMTVAVAVSLSACGGTRIDDGKAEKFITSTVVNQVGAHVKSVTCPKGKTAKKGDTFSCTVVGTDGSKGDVLVTERDAKGNVHVSAPFVHSREIEASIASSLGKKVRQKVGIACPEIIDARTAAVFACVATDEAGKTARVEAVQEDAKGHVKYHLTQ